MIYRAGFGVERARPVLGVCCELLGEAAAPLAGLEQAAAAARERLEPARAISVQIKGCKEYIYVYKPYIALPAKLANKRWCAVKHATILGHSPAVMATVVLNLDDGSCALLDVTAMKYPDAAAVVSYVQDVVASARLDPKQVVGLMADNVSYMTAAVNTLVELPGYQGWQRFRCVAHIINLVVQQILPACGEIEPMLRTTATLWNHGSQPVKAALRGVLGSAVTKGNDTRWAHFMEGVAHMVGKEDGQMRWWRTLSALSSVDSKYLSDTAQSYIARLEQTRMIVGFAVAHSILGEVPALLTALQGQPMTISCMQSVHGFFSQMRDQSSISAMVENAIQGALALLNGTLDDRTICLPAVCSYNGGVLLPMDLIALKDKLGKALHTSKDIVDRNYMKLMHKVVRQKAIVCPDVHVAWRPLAKNAIKPNRLKSIVRQDLVSGSQYAAVLRSLQSRLSENLKATALPGEAHCDEESENIVPAPASLSLYSRRVNALPLSSASVERVFSVMTRQLSDACRSRMLPETLLGDIFLMANRPITKAMLAERSAEIALGQGIAVRQLGAAVVIARAGNKRAR